MLGGVTCLALGLAQESFAWTMVRGLSRVLGSPPAALASAALWHTRMPYMPCQTGAASDCRHAGDVVLCSIASQMHNALCPCQVVVVLFSIFVQGACGASFGVVPFVSLRAREALLWHAPAQRQHACMATDLLRRNAAALDCYAAMFAPPQRSLDILMSSHSGAQGCVLPVHAGGLVYGFVGAGGNTGGAITQAIFFTPASLEPYDSFKWLG